jgi:hypothetical protein
VVLIMKLWDISSERTSIKDKIKKEIIKRK